MSEEFSLERLFARYVEQHVRNGQRLPVDKLCAGSDELLEPLRMRIASYHRIDGTLDSGSKRSRSRRRK